MIFAPAKINLGLKITGRYANGYHRLETVFIPVSLADRLQLSPAAGDSVRHIWPAEIDAESRGVLAAGALKNPLLLRVLDFMRGHLGAKFGKTLPHFAVTVQKRIPSPSGLGGASADAAALVAALLGVAGLGQEIRQSPDFARCLTPLGADIPYFLRFGLEGTPARLRGAGHELAPVGMARLAGWLCVPPFGFPTDKMFAHVRTLPLPLIAEDETPKPILSLRLNEIPYSDCLADGVRVVANDFDSAAGVVFPSASRILSAAKISIARTATQFLPGSWVVGMTGSGAGLFAATEAAIPMPELVMTARVLHARLGGIWQVFPFHTKG